jgi:SAM-dependent methyltransferase
MDIAGGKVYGRFMGLREENVHSLNVLAGPDVTHVGDAEQDIDLMLAGQYDAVVSLNYLILAMHPEQVVANAARLLVPGGIAIVDFVGLTYWYVACDGRHWQTYNPGRIDALLRPHFAEFVIVPVGNWLQGMFNYYWKRGESRLARWLFMFLGSHLGCLDRDPSAAIHYLAVAKKSG